MRCPITTPYDDVTAVAPAPSSKPLGAGRPEPVRGGSGAFRPLRAREGAKDGSYVAHPHRATALDARELPVARGRRGRAAALLRRGQPAAHVHGGAEGGPHAARSVRVRAGLSLARRRDALVHLAEAAVAAEDVAAVGVEGAGRGEADLHALAAPGVAD